MFAEDLDFLFADFSVIATFNNLRAKVIFDQPDDVFVSSMQVLTEYQITYKSEDLPGLKHGSTISIDSMNKTFSVKDSRKINDGALSIAGLSII